MIKVENLSKSFNGFVAVDDLSFQVSPGEVLGFLGPNGAGKSTTMKMISGFIRQDSGSISVFDHDVQREPLESKRLLGYLPEGAPAWGEMSSAAFLDFIANIRGLRGEYKRQRTRAIVDELELHDVLDRPIDTLSKGFKRRIGIAQATIHDPRVLILDEPTDGLDPNQKHQVRELIRNLATDRIVIISTHILEEVHAVCSRALIIASGKLLVDNTPAELEARSRYHNAVTLELRDNVDVGAELAEIVGVDKVECSPLSSNCYTVFPSGSAPLYAIIDERARSLQWPVRALYTERGRLDDVFRQITQSASSAMVT